MMTIGVGMKVVKRALIFYDSDKQYHKPFYEK